MKLKLVVTSMCVLGLMSCPAFAATQTKQKVNHEHFKGEETVGYKDEGLKLYTCPKVSIYEPIMDAMSQNVGRAKPTVDCNKPIQFAGGINFDTTFGNLNEGFMGENNTRFTLNDAYLNTTAGINEWVTAFIALSYNNIKDSALNGARLDHFVDGEEQGPLPGIYSAGSTLNALDIEQAIITIGNPEKFPLFLKLGKQYQDFGRYTIHPITRSMTQVMTETLQTSVELSFISAYNNMDLHGSAFVFQNQITQGDDDFDIDEPETENSGNNGKTNFGVQLGFGKVSNQLGWDIGAGYIYNMFGVNDIAYAAAFFKGAGEDENSPIDVSESFYVKRVSGATAYGMVNSGPFSLSAHYVTALQHFDPADFGFSTDEEDDDGDGIQPWAADIQAAYGFNYWERSQNIYVGYQRSGDAAQLLIPEQRWIAGYGIDVLKNTNIGLEYSYDKAYDEEDFQDGENTNRVAVRVAVKFG